MIAETATHLPFTPDQIVAPALAPLLEQSAALHRHLCPRQVLGARMGVYAGELLQLEVPQARKRLYVFVETDGCFADGVSVATNCWLGRRTMRLMDVGKAAATFVDTETGHAIRIWPNATAREYAHRYAPEAQSRWHTYLAAYQVMPTDKLLCARQVQLTIDMKALVSRNGIRVQCEQCGEEIINGREVVCNERVLCRHCGSGDRYWEE